MSAHTIEIIVRDRLGPTIVAALDGFEVTGNAGGGSRIVGVVPDQAKLLGILDMFDGLHVEVVSVNRIDEGQVSSAGGDATHPLRP
ncbi:hypothetical protein [Microbacterium terricola]|uniref:Uncharacterized protein n=1 Tax=Microbacterium terricola TaxID=344163 RepID=A0ABM8DVC3_9MICO|nr:hypothetical protein [Microbacterium terricola]UYK39631.1 hypothetical protein OAU46_13140 [Microbacterium terricola]BDV29628.1 hypothetical protein Microterr_02880 [Microbacterium terricola]